MLTATLIIIIILLLASKSYLSQVSKVAEWDYAAKEQKACEATKALQDEVYYLRRDLVNAQSEAKRAESTRNQLIGAKS